MRERVRRGVCRIARQLFSRSMHCPRCIEFLHLGVADNRSRKSQHGPQTVAGKRMYVQPKKQALIDQGVIVVGVRLHEHYKKCGVVKEKCMRCI
eukprot:jgi/Botrbrau1/14832/Bobra.0278s0002.1